MERSQQNSQCERALLAMREPGFYPHRPGHVEVIETHISTVFLAGDRAYKVKRQLELPFVDYSTLARRRHFCREEVRLNRRLAPDVYIGVRAIVHRGDSFILAGPEDQPAVEYAVEMRRLPMDSTLDRLVKSHRASLELVERIANRIADFHETASRTTAYGGPADVKARVDENLATLLPWADLMVDADVLSAIERFCDGFALGNRELLAGRVVQGHVREGHGDLRAEHIVDAGGQLTIYDCVEFDESLRFVDVASDLAFLYMDLEHLGAASLAGALVRAYVKKTGDEQVYRLLPFFACYRALVRAKVACVRLQQLPESDPRARPLLDEGRSLATLALRLAWRSRLPLVLVFCGVGASGKSTLAEEVSRRSGLVRLSSDLIRKRLAGVSPHERGPEGMYDDTHTMLTYDELLQEALELSGTEGGVVVDATFARRSHREAVAQAFRAMGARVLFCECRAAERVLHERAGARRQSPESGSDATWDVVRSQLGRFEPLDEVPAGDHFVVRTDRPIQETLAAVESFVGLAVDGAAWRP